MKELCQSPITSLNCETDGERILRITKRLAAEGPRGRLLPGGIVKFGNGVMLGQIPDESAIQPETTDQTIPYSSANRNDST
jgi:hypothetical protein